MSLSHFMVAAALVLAAIAAAQQPNQENEVRAKRFVEYYEATVRPLEIEATGLSVLRNTHAASQGSGQRRTL